MEPPKKECSKGKGKIVSPSIFEAICLVLDPLHSWLFDVFIQCIVCRFCTIGTTLGKYIEFLSIYQIISLKISLFGRRLFHVFLKILVYFFLLLVHCLRVVYHLPRKRLVNEFENKNNIDHGIK